MLEIKLKTKDKIEIAINHFQNGFDSVLLIFPGWFMTKDCKAFKQISEAFCKYSDVICIDFRGHGKSKGYYSFTKNEIFDIEAVIEYAKSKYSNINIMGFSLGASLSLIAGAKYKYINKIIAISPATNFYKIENHFWKPQAWIPTFKKFEFSRWGSIRPEIPFGKRINPIDIVDKIECPTLFVAGEKDPTVYPWHTEELFKKAICKKKYELFKDCFHAEDLFLDRQDKFVKICHSWLFTE